MTGRRVAHQDGAEHGVRNEHGAVSGRGAVNGHGGRPPALDWLGRMSLALPDTTIKPAQGAAAYHVRGKSFAMAMHDHHGNARTELWVKSSMDQQQEWVAGDAHRYYVPPYVGKNGWLGVWLDTDVDWPAVAELLVEGYLIQAGPRAAAGLDPGTLVATALAAG